MVLTQHPLSSTFKTLGQRRGLKKPWAGEKENKNALRGCVCVSSQNGLNSLILILNWCTGGCFKAYFSPCTVLQETMQPGFQCSSILQKKSEEHFVHVLRCQRSA
jgi:hypothetical protein